MTDFDAIVIGSGIGGMTHASIVTQTLESKVLVLERHFELGGYTHTFKRPGGFEWDVGIHYVGSMAEGYVPRAILDFITDSNLGWLRINDPFDVFEYPGYRFEQHGNPKRFMEDLITDFPHERKAIQQYFVDIKRAANWFSTRFESLALPFPMNIPATIKWKREAAFCLQSTKDYLDAAFTDERLKTVLASTWGDCGLPPDQAPLVLQAAIVRHYLHGGYYPEGGSASIVDAIKPIIESTGGEMRKRHEVMEILLDGKRAVGVKVKSKKGIENIFAPVIVSDVGAYNTYAKLLPPQFGSPIARDIEMSGVSSVTLYVGFNDDPSKLGFNGANHWMFADYHHEITQDGTLESGIPGCFLSIPSLRDPSRKRHSAEIIVLTHDDAFEEWAHLSWKERHNKECPEAKAYRALKEDISKRMLDYVEARHPGFKAMVEYHEVSTPLSAKEFTDHPRGTAYGMLGTKERFTDPSLGFKTPIKNLYMAGADSFTAGLLSCAMSGVGSASCQMDPPGLMGRLGLRGPPGLQKVMDAVKKRAE